MIAPGWKTSFENLAAKLEIDKDFRILLMPGSRDLNGPGNFHQNHTWGRPPKKGDLLVLEDGPYRVTKVGPSKKSGLKYDVEAEVEKSLRGVDPKTIDFFRG